MTLVVVLYVFPRVFSPLNSAEMKNLYRKVASSRPVYYSIFDHFWGATNQDVLLLPCPAINQLISIRV